MLIVMRPHIILDRITFCCWSVLTTFGQILAKNVLHLLAIIDLSYILTIAFQMLLVQIIWTHFLFIIVFKSVHVGNSKINYYYENDFDTAS